MQKKSISNGELNWRAKRAAAEQLWCRYHISYGILGQASRNMEPVGVLEQYSLDLGRKETLIMQQVKSNHMHSKQCEHHGHSCRTNVQYIPM